MQQLENRSDEELEAETRFRCGRPGHPRRAGRGADGRQARREHYRVAIAASRPQERLQLRRMAEASLAIAERRPGDLKVAAEKLGQTPPTSRQLLAAAGDGHRSRRRRARASCAAILGVLIVIAAIILAARHRLGHRQPHRAPVRRGRRGRLVFWGFLLVAIVLGGLVLFGTRRRQKTARAQGRRGGAPPQFKQR